MEQVIGLIGASILGGLFVYIIWPKKVTQEEPSPAENNIFEESMTSVQEMDAVVPVQVDTKGDTWSSLTSLKKSELKDLCAKQGIAVKANDTKAVLIQKLES